MPLCGGYLLLSIKSDVLEITVGMIKKVIHFNGKNHLFYDMISPTMFDLHINQDIQ